MMSNTTVEIDGTSTVQIDESVEKVIEATHQLDIAATTNTTPQTINDDVEADKRVDPNNPCVIYTIGIAGGSGAGKTTLAKKVFESLGGEDNVCYLVHDAYYKDQSSKTYMERCRTNFDHPDSLESDLMLDHVKALKEGRSVSVPVYDFSTHTRKANEFHHLSPKPILMLEGILLLTEPQLVKEMDLKVFVDAEPDVRFIRRLTRDCAERGRTMEQVVDQYRETVRPMHNLFVEPGKRVADLIVHASHHGISTFDISCSVLTNHLRAVAEEYRLQGTVNDVDVSDKNDP